MKRMRTAVLTAALALLGAGGCTPEADDTSPVRLIESDRPELFSTTEISTTATVFDWTFHDQGAAEIEERAWLAHAPPWRVDRVGLLPSAPRATLATTLPLARDAAELDALALTVRGFRGGSVELYWTRTGEPWGADRGMKLERLPPGTANERRFVFAVHTHPSWSGRIEQLRLVFHNPHEIPMIVRRLEGLDYTLEADRLRAAVSRPWKIKLGEDTRTALLSPPGLEIQREVALPAEESTLRFAYAVTRPTATPVTFRVFSGRRGSTPRRLLFEAVHEAAAEAGAWQPVEVPLVAEGQRRQTLVLETQSSDGSTFDLLHAMPVWAHPEIVGPDPKPMPSVVLISIDTLRADHLSLYGYPKPTSPEIDAWAKRSGVTFDDAIVQAPWTLPSHVSMLSGVDALRHGANQAQSRTPSGLPLLATMLRDAGYRTEAITGAGYLHPRFRLTVGHDVYHSSEDELQNDIEAAVDRALDRIDRERRPLYLFFHTYQVHSPYLPHEPWYTELSGGRPAPEAPVYPNKGAFYAQGSDEPLADPAVGVALYDSGIAHMDAHLGRLLRRLEEPDLASDTIVIFTSDHGESLGERGEAGHGHLSEANLLAPLVLALPDRSGAGERIAQQVRSIDIVPTVLDVIGLEQPAGIEGTSLLPLVAGTDAEFPTLATSYASKDGLGLALRADGRIKYTVNNGVWSRGSGEEALYDLRAGPEEVESLAPGHPRTRDFRAEARRRMVGAGGLWLRIANGGDTTLSGRVEAPGIDRHTVTSPDVASCRCAKLEGSGVATFSVPPAGMVRLLLEVMSSDELTIELTAPDGRREPTGRFRHVFDVSRLTERAAVVERDAHWSLVEGYTGDIATGVEVWWNGHRHAGSADIYADPELADQLRALGYVN